MRLIDADALIAKYDAMHVGAPGMARKLIVEAPTVDAVPVVHGRWIVPVPGDGEPYCSACKCDALACGYWFYPTLNRYYKTPFCAHCGAKMDE